MNTKDLGSEILRILGYIEEGVSKYREGIVMYSEEPYGSLFDLTPEMSKVVADLQSNGLEVYAVIKGKYILGEADVMESTSYLYIAGDMVDRAENNITNGFDVLNGIVERLDQGYGYSVSAYVTGWYDEYGNIGVKGRLGGLTRTC